MRTKEKKRNKALAKKRRRIASRIRGTVERPRLRIFRSARHIYAQIIDDTSGQTLAAASTLTTGVLADLEEGGGKKAAAHRVGKKVAEIAQERGISQVAFDRGVFRYHGRIKALAEGAREGGLQF